MVQCVQSVYFQPAIVMMEWPSRNTWKRSCSNSKAMGGQLERS
ncbi:hypothetical protein F442_12561 [Phytophthora nicotianae P10297]|uniref:Uncharacterized protein n=3 Tax=Phytophthora nicotianae TaxID=4792 RepID=W2PZK9_PHYN3|nr:hypothetical protein PPTG_23470 [Phytophthora nicotianae INRA-310]ETN05475.1 hypothetical protein PPTG_23470 [Phytophthora nicotianae INRA-310]ETO70808.1 hypothetical protein F444_12760 [Phytophthora nicotianae P1976]ETP40050.1 hypothetical protein F442_12561 [Phytophthora nicotianae P10297]